jgi:hypothetical protein
VLAVFFAAPALAAAAMSPRVTGPTLAIESPVLSKSCTSLTCYSNQHDAVHTNAHVSAECPAGNASPKSAVITAHRRSLMQQQQQQARSLAAVQMAAGLKLPLADPFRPRSLLQVRP